jgi:hypothetical protein
VASERDLVFVLAFVVRKVFDLDLDFDIVYMLNIPATKFLRNN